MKKSIATLLAIVLVLTSLFALNLIASAADTSPEWLASTNSFIEKNEDCLSSTKIYNPQSYSEYWSTYDMANVHEFTFKSEEQMRSYYASGVNMELRFYLQNQTNTNYVNSSLVTDGNIPLSNITTDMAVSVWVNAPKNMQLKIAFFAKDGNRYTTDAITVNNGWQQLIVPVSSFKTLNGTKNLKAINVTPIAVKNGDEVDYVTSWNYGEKLRISLPQIVKNVDSTLSSVLAQDIITFEEKQEDLYEFSSGKGNGLTAADTTVDGKNGVRITMSDAETYYATAYHRDKTHIWFKKGIGTLTQKQYDYGYLKFYVKTSKAMEFDVFRLDKDYQQVHNNTLEISVAASGDGFTEVIVPISEMGIKTGGLVNVAYVIAPSRSSFDKQTFLSNGESIFISDIELCVDMTNAAITAANTITAEQTDDSSSAENGFTGLRKLTVKDSSFYALSDTDRAITHIFDTTVAQGNVDYLGFWVKAPKAMTLKLTIADNNGKAVTTDIAVNGTLKQGGYQFVTVSREQLKLNELSDIVSLTLTPQNNAEEFLGEGEALYYSAFTLYSGKPVSFYESYKTGDANGNGIVDIRDMVRAASGTDITYAADLSENGKIDAADMLAYRNILLGIE